MANEAADVQYAPIVDGVGPSLRDRERCELFRTPCHDEPEVGMIIVDLPRHEPAAGGLRGDELSHALDGVDRYPIGHSRWRDFRG